MSAYVVNTDHIDLLVSAMLDTQHTFTAYNVDSAGEVLGRFAVDHTTADEAGRMLYQTNVDSVQYRYPADTFDELPGLIDKPAVEDYRFRRVLVFGADLPAVAILQAIDGYEYQSCEHPGWHLSMAKAMTDLLRRKLVTMLPGYSTHNTWEYDRPADAPQVVSLMDLARRR